MNNFLIDIERLTVFQHEIVNKKRGRCFKDKDFLTTFVQKFCSRQMKETFGMYIRRLRESHDLPLRKVAAALDIDPSTLSKIERDERVANREMVEKLATLFSIDKNVLIITLLSDKVVHELVGETCSEQILKEAGEKIKYIKYNSLKQSELGF